MILCGPAEEAHINRSISALLLLVATACGGAEVASTSSSTSTTPASSSSAAATTTTTVAMISTTAPTTSTTEAPTTSTSGPAAAGTFGSQVLGNSPPTTTSGRFEATFSVTPGPDADFTDEVSFTMSGAFADNGDAEFLMDFGDLLLAAQGTEEIPEEFIDLFAEPMQMKVVGDTSYIKWGFFAMFFGTDKWIATDVEDSETVTSGFGFGADGDSPTELLEALAGANAQVEELGQEEVRGVTTTHYRALLDLETLAGDLTEAERQKLESDVGDLGVVDFPIDVWIGEDGNVYRYAITLDAAAAGVADEQFTAASIVFDIWDYGADVVIEPPPDDEVATEDEIGFGFGDT